MARAWGWGMVAAGGIILAAPTQAATRWPATQEVDGSSVITVLPPDAIPAVDAPRFVPADAAPFMQDDEPVLGVTDGRETKAYSAWQLNYHEIVNDTLSGRPIAVTW